MHWQIASLGTVFDHHYPNILNLVVLLGVSTELCQNQPGSLARALRMFNMKVVCRRINEAARQLAPDSQSAWPDNESLTALLQWWASSGNDLREVVAICLLAGLHLVCVWQITRELFKDKYEHAPVALSYQSKQKDLMLRLRTWLNEHGVATMDGQRSHTSEHIL